MECIRNDAHPGRMVTFVTSKDKVLLTLLAMLKGPFKKVSLLLTTAMLKVLGSPAVDVLNKEIRQI